MFTGIIESLGVVAALRPEGSNLHITIRASISNELKIDQSVSHNGVCLTVVQAGDGMHTVTAVDETLQRSNLGQLQTGDVINLERCLRIGDRLDGHMVQGHVDATARLLSAEDQQGSWLLTFGFEPARGRYIVNKGSISLNGISLTVFGVTENTFSVAIIPYTWEHTNLSKLKAGDYVNVEFDIIGKYVEKMMRGQKGPA